MVKPREAEYQPIICQICLLHSRIQRTWMDEETKSFCCPIHGSVAITGWAPGT